MKSLPNVTLICVSTNDITGAVDALIKSSVGIKFGEVKLLTSVGATFEEDNGISIVNIGTIFRHIDDWNKFIFYDLHKYIDTEFVLLIHPDGYVIRPDLWKDEFLNYDYCGAPFLPNTIFDIYGEEVRVGNSVSVRSKRLLELPSKLNLPWKEYNGSYNEDTQITAHYRPYFLGAGMTFAPLEIAKYFSKENNTPEQKKLETFAFHKWELLTLTPETTYTSYVNLDNRPDRKVLMEDQLVKAGISAERQRGFLPDEVRERRRWDEIAVMWNRTKGATGCWESQVEIMKKALEQGKHAFVMEDDLIFCDDIQDRLRHMEEFLTDHQWDIMWLGGTYHKEPTWHKRENGKHTHADLLMCGCDKDCDWEPTDDPLIVRTYGCWSTYAYIVNKDRLAHILDSLDQNMYRSMGIDWTMILLQPQLYTYAFNPGCVIQRDNESNIGTGMTRFSVFSNLGDHWYKEHL
jgi:GR25 family glycosyltransferase involved in LPS biosynthesis